jgi:RNA polymerase sigma-70 factor (ECF subfamily)
MSSREKSDDDVVRSAKAGDEQAWRDLYAALAGRLHGWLEAQAMFDASIDADDLLNETWLTAARRIADFTGSRDDFAGWIFVIARNLTANVNRRGIRRATTPTELDPEALGKRQVVEDIATEVAGSFRIRQLLELLQSPKWTGSPVSI